MAFRLCNKDKMMKPRRCVICESHPGHRVVDTGYNLLATTVFDKLRGRKYVCEACGEKIGKALGMIGTAQAGNMKEELIRLQNSLEVARADADVAAQVASLRTFLLREESQNAVVQDSEG